MKVLLDIQDEKALHLIEVLRSLPYVTTTITDDENLILESNFSFDGVEISKLELLQKIEAAENRIDLGKFISQEDLEKEAESW